MTKNLNTARLELGLATMAAETTAASGAASTGSLWVRQGDGVSTPTQLFLNLSGGTTGWCLQNLVDLRVYNVIDFGAVGNGVADDTAAINAAVNSAEASGIGGIIYFPPGTYRVTKPGTGIGSVILSNNHDLVFLGDGASSVISMIGSAGFGDWYAFRIRNGSSRIRFYDLAFASAITSPDPAEQNHFINLSGVAGDPLGGPHDVEVANCYFGNLPGDAVRTIGESTEVINNLRVIANDFDTGASGGSRSCIGCQRFSNDILVAFNYLSGSHDQQIDFEPTAGDGPKGWIIMGNHADASSSLSEACFSMSGSGATDNLNDKRLVMAFNTITNGGSISGINLSTCVVIGNIVTVNITDASAANSPIEMTRHVQHCQIYGNVAINQNTVNNRIGIRIVGFNPQTADHNAIVDNIATAMGTTAAGGIDAEGSTTETVIAGNLVEVDCTTANKAYGISATATEAAMNHIASVGNMIFGSNQSLKMGVQYSCTGFTYRNCQANDNWIRHSGAIIFFENGPFTDWRGVHGNNGVDVTGQPIQMSTFEGVTLEGAQGPGAQIAWLNLAAGPNGHVAAPVGSLLVDVGGGQGAVFWVKETGSGVSGGASGWVPQGASEIVMGTADTTNVAAARFLAPGGQALLNASSTEIQFTITRPGAIRNLRVVAQAGSLGVNNTYTVRKNGVNTTLTVTISNAATSGSDISHSFAVAAGDLISVSISKDGVPATTQKLVTVTVDFSS